MTTYYLSSVDGSDASDGLSWDNAYATFKYAVETASAAASGPHILLVDSAHSEGLSAATTVTAAGDIRVICVNRGTGALATGAVIGNQTTSNYSLTVNGAFRVYIYGLKLWTGNKTTGGVVLTINSTDGGHFELEQCSLFTSGTSSSRLSFGLNTNTGNVYTKLINCTFSFDNAAQYARHYCSRLEMLGCTLDSGGTSPTALFGSVGGQQGANTICEACDFSHQGSNTLVADMAGNGRCDFVFSNCKIGSGTVLAAATTVTNKGQTTVNVWNCASGDTHYVLGHYDAFGETTVSATIYANDGAAYDGTNRCSWKIVTTANCSYYTPYVSPWMDVYHSGTSAISPYLEILRSGSTTKYQNDEVWGEFSYQGTSGSTMATIVSDRMTPLGTAADQTASSLDASGWTGEDATNNAFMKLEAGSITPAEIGHIRARVCVGEPSITVYVDPKIRGLS